jgi:catechol 2,3-dioxygenase-like lactoylglutathione lyase family enzyme
MKRMHIHMSVGDLDRSVDFYSALFAARPTVLKPDYAKWMLDDPRVNFAISTRSGRAAGVDHLGIQVEDGAELDEVYARLERADGPTLEEGRTTCCYAESEKSWITDPQGVPWEAFLTTGESTVYGRSVALPSRTGQAGGAACCGAPARTAPDADAGETRPAGRG